MVCRLGKLYGSVDRLVALMGKNQVHTSGPKTNFQLSQSLGRRKGFLYTVKEKTDVGVADVCFDRGNVDEDMITVHNSKEAYR